MPKRVSPLQGLRALSLAPMLSSAIPSTTKHLSFLTVCVRVARRGVRQTAPRCERECVRVNRRQGQHGLHTHMHTSPRSNRVSELGQFILSQTCVRKNITARCARAHTAGSTCTYRADMSVPCPRCLAHGAKMVVKIRVSC